MTTRLHQPSAIRIEQAVYGSFAFWARGYAVLAQSPGCRAEWVAEFRAACQKLGERPSGVADAPGLFALRLKSGPWAVVGVEPQGADDRGRPGALAFHGLILSHASYRKIGCDPFALAGALRSDWSAETLTLSLPTLAWVVEPPDLRVPADPDPRAPRIAAALGRGRRVALEAPGPIDDLARQVWRLLPGRVRARASVATWAFGNGNRFDLLALPRLAGVALDASYVAPSTLEANGDGEGGATLRFSPRMIAATGAAALLALAAVGLALRGDADDADDTDAPAPGPVATSRAIPVSPTTAAVAPATPDPDDRDDDPGEPRRVTEALLDLAERFGVDPGSDPMPDPAALMEHLADALRYRGPLLSERERAALRRDPAHDAALALRWDALARRFTDDRSLPADFRRRTLRSQLVALAWSFHSEGDPRAPRRAASEVAQALADALAVDVPLRPTPLTERYPALASYLSFLGRLPRR
jgi:hypothetical protein